MNWDNLTKIAARTINNSIGRNLTIFLENGEEFQTRGIISTKSEGIKNSNFEVEDYSLQAAILKDKIKNPDDVKKVFFDSKNYSIVKYLFDIDGFYTFYLKEIYA